MLKHLLIPGTSLRVSQFALGVMPWGTSVNAQAARRLYDLYREAGGNTLDTAHIYAAWRKNGNGASERALGELLRTAGGGGDRRSLIIISKGGHASEPFYPRPDKYLSPDTLRSDIADTLERTGLESIDLYFLHRDDARVPVSEIIDSLNAHVAAGHIRYIGASNWRVDRIQQANDYAAAQTAAGKPLMGFVASQPQFNLALPNFQMTDDPTLRHITPPDIAWHTQHNFPAFCYSPTAQGYFATNGTKSKEPYDNPTSRARLQRLNQLAPLLHATPTQLALAYLLHHPFPTIPILGTSNPTHLTEALHSINIPLTPAQLTWLEQGGSDTPPL